MGSFCWQARDTNTQHDGKEDPAELPVHLLFYAKELHKYSLIAAATDEYIRGIQREMNIVGLPRYLDPGSLRCRDQCEIDLRKLVDGVLPNRYAFFGAAHGENRVDRKRGTQPLSRPARQCIIPKTRRLSGENASMPHGRIHPLTPESRNYLVIAFIGILLAAIFYTELNAPFEETIWTLYMVPLIFTIWVRQRPAPFVVAGTSIFLIIVSYLAATPEGLPFFAIFNRALYSAILIIVAFGIYFYLAGVRARLEKERQLKESEQRYRALVESSPDAVIVHRDGRFLYANPVALKLYGAESFEQLQSRTLLDLVHPDEREAIAARIQQGQAGKDLPIRETRMLRLDGTELVVESAGGMVDFQGEPAVQIIFRDITERKKIEDALYIALQRLTHHISNSPLAVVEFDPGFRIIRWSEEARCIFGWTEEEVMGKAISDIPWVYEEDAESVREISADMLSGKSTRNMHVNRNYRKDGSVVYCEWYNSALRDDRGELVSILSQILDVTERREAERRLRETSQYLENLIDYANSPIIVWDPQFHITRFNHAFERLTGRMAGDVVGQPLEILFPPEWRDASMDLIKPTSRGERWEVVEFPVGHMDGSIRTVIWNSATIFDEDGKSVLSTIAQGTDITDRKKAEEKIRHLATFPHMNPMPVIELDRDGSITFCNEATHQILLRLGEEDNPSLFFPDSMKEILGDLARGRTDPFYGEVHIRGATFGENIYFAPEMGIVRIYANDITVLRNTAEELKQYAEKLARSNKELEQFAYVASHDLREPLRMVTLFSQLLEERYQGKLDADAREFIHYIVEGGTRMNDLVNDLLEYSRVSSRARPFLPTDMNAVVEDVIRDLAVGICESGAVVHVDDLPVVLADRSQMRQVFLNLLANAIKFRGENVPRISVGAKWKDNEWVFSVRDNGIGINPLYSQKIFDIFQRLHSREKYPGTGIGLAICRRIVERHGGRIWVESIEGEGSTFSFTIPCEIREGM
jgi:PAS domain S-box-containing protein